MTCFQCPAAALDLSALFLSGGTKNNILDNSELSCNKHDATFNTYYLMLKSSFHEMK